MNSQQEKIWEYLSTYAYSIDNAKTIRTVADAVGEPPSGTNDDKVRGLIAKMVTEHRKPIGTFEGGVFIITNNQECEIAARFVERKSRAADIREIWKNLNI